MSLRVSWLWAKRIISLRGASQQRKRQIIGSVVVIAVSMIPLVVSLILADGMILGITDRYVNFQSGHLQLQRRTSGDLGIDRPYVDDTSIRSISELPHVVECIRSIKGLSLLYSRHTSISAEITGIEPSYISSSLDHGMTVIAGEAHPIEEKDLVLSKVLAEELAVDLGDTVTILSVQERDTGTFFKPMLMRITGIISTGYTELDRQLAFTTLKTAGSLFFRTKSAEETASVSTVLIRMDTSEINVVRQVAQQIERILDEAGTSYHILTWEEMNPALFHNFSSTRNILMIIMSIIIVIAGVNVASSMTLLIQENRQHIGILQALGTDSIYIALGLFIAILIMTCVGTIIGLTCGTIIGVNLNGILSWIAQLDIAASEMYLLSIPITIRISDLCYIAVFTVMIASLSVIGPLRKIKQYQPIEILK